MQAVKLVSSFVIPQDSADRDTRLTESKTRIYGLSAVAGAAAGALGYALAPRSYAPLTFAVVAGGTAYFCFAGLQLLAKAALTERAVAIALGSKGPAPDVVKYMRENPEALESLCSQDIAVNEENWSVLWDLICGITNVNADNELFKKVEGSLFKSKNRDLQDKFFLAAIKALKTPLVDYLLNQHSLVWRFYLTKILKEQTDQQTLLNFWSYTKDQKLDESPMWELVCKLKADVTADPAFKSLVDKLFDADPTLKYSAFLKAIRERNHKIIDYLALNKGVKVEEFLQKISNVPEDVKRSIDLETFTAIYRECRDRKVILDQNNNSLWEFICKFDRMTPSIFSLYDKLVKGLPELEQVPRVNNDLLKAVTAGCTKVVKRLLQYRTELKAPGFTLSEYCEFWIHLSDSRTANRFKGRLWTEFSKLISNQQEVADLLTNIVSRTTDSYPNPKFTQFDHVKLLLSTGFTKGIEKAYQKAVELEKPQLAELIAAYAALASFIKKKPDATLSNRKLITPGCYQILRELMRPYGAADLTIAARRDLWHLVCKFDDADETPDSLFTKLSEYAKNRKTECYEPLRSISSENDLEDKFFIAVGSKAPKVVESLLKSKKIQAIALSAEQQRLCLEWVYDNEMTRLLERHGFKTTP